MVSHTKLRLAGPVLPLGLAADSTPSRLEILSVDRAFKCLATHHCQAPLLSILKTQASFGMVAAAALKFRMQVGFISIFV